MIEDLSECYRILELAPGATQEEAKRSYRELVKVWHPDRFAGDPKLQKKAQEKLKQINLAYERICKGEAGEPRRRSSSPGTSASQAGEQSRPAGSSDSANNRGEPRTEAPRQPPPPRPQPPPAPATNWGRRFAQFAGTVVIIVVIKAVFSTGDRSRRSQPSQSYSRPESAVVQSQSKARQHLTIEQILELKGEASKSRPDLRMSVQEFSRYMQANQSDYDFSEGIAYSPPQIAAQPEHVPPQVASAPVFEQPAAPDKPASPARETIAPSKPTVESTKKVEVALAKTRDSVLPPPSRDFFTVGSTKDEVLAIQGTPSQFNDSSFSYGGSTVHFRNGRVASWYDGYPKLKVRLLPTSKIEAGDFFTVGSTKDDVLAIQGTPSQFSDSTFTYGGSTVRFKNGKVASWYDGYPKLKVRLLPASKVVAADYFTVASTKDEVLAIQGTPSQFSDYSFTYGGSTVRFKDGRVVSWYDGYPKLKVKLLPTSKIEATEFFTIGSTKDEVLAVQGTPSQFSDSSFTYGGSTVHFKNGKVASWYDGYPKLKVRLAERSP